MFFVSPAAIPCLSGGLAGTIFSLFISFTFGFYDVVEGVWFRIDFFSSVGGYLDVFFLQLERSMGEPFDNVYLCDT